MTEPMGLEAGVLDATAGNRMIWKTKTSPHILWIDIDSELEISPDKIMDCTQTNFPDKSFYSIFFDPPHGWGKEPGESMFACRNKKEQAKYQFKHSEGGLCYYGWDKFKTKTKLLSFIHNAQREFTRILKDDGMLWVKWNEVKIPLNKILPFFKDWNEMLRFHISSPLQRFSETQTYWIMFMKKGDVPKILDLAEFTNDNASKGAST